MARAQHTAVKTEPRPGPIDVPGWQEAVKDGSSQLCRLSNPKMDLWICCDEAARLVARSDHASNIADLIGLVRGTGIGLDLSLQAAEVLPAVLSNTAIKCIGRCSSALDIETIGAAMGLSNEQKRWICTHLEPGLFVGQVGEDWRHPFVFRVPNIPWQSLAASNNPSCNLLEVLGV